MVPREIIGFHASRPRWDATNCSHRGYPPVHQTVRALRSCFPEDEYVLVSDQLPGSPVGFVSQRWWSLGVQSEMRRLARRYFMARSRPIPAAPAVRDDNSRPVAMAARAGSGRLAPHPAADSPADPAWGRNHDCHPKQGSTNEAISEFRVAPERVIAVPLGSPPSGSVSAIPPGPAMLSCSLARLSPRKNVQALVAASPRLRTEANLVLIGRHRRTPADTEQTRYSSASARCLMPTCPPGTPARPPACIHLYTKASGCPCWRRCSLAFRDHVEGPGDYRSSGGRRHPGGCGGF